MRVEFSILGPTELRVDDRIVPLGPAKQRGLLALLLYRAGNPVRTDSVVELLWPGRPVDPCRPLLYSLASRLRAILRGAGLPEALVRVASTGAYRLDVDRNTVDYHRFLHLAAEARLAASRQRYDRSTALLATAVSLWRDDPLADLRGAQAEHLRRDMQGKLLDAYKLLAEHELHMGHHHTVLTRLEPLMRENEFDERLASLWAAALHASGRTHDTRAFITTFRQSYRRKMRADPVLDHENIQDVVTQTTTTSGDANLPQRRKNITTVWVPQQLPNDVSDFTGHAQLLADLDKFASDDATAKVIVLTGMPGVGKTTLATHWGQRRREWFPDGQLYLNAEAHGPVPPVRPENALSSFLSALGVPAERIPVEHEQRRTLYLQLVAGRRVLVVLDNVLDSNQARQLLPRSDTCLTIITSRNRLKGLTIREGIRSLTVPPLPEPERRHLLSNIFGPERVDVQPQALNKLGNLSGGLPLALRVIGEHVVSRPHTRIDDLAHELTSRLLDCEGDETDDATLRTVFGWSVNALTPAAALLFLRLGVFPGTTISAGAAAALLKVDHPHAEAALNTLARAHLVNHDTLGRYRMHDLLRLYATDRSIEDETLEQRRAAIHRILDWYLLTANNAIKLLEPERPPVPDLPDPTTVTVTPEQFASDTDAMRWSELERTNLHAAVRAAATAGFHRHAWQIPGVTHEIFDRYGPQNDVLDALHVAVEAAAADGHDVGRIGTFINLGATYFATHDYRRAADAFEDALRLAQSIELIDAQVICMHNLADVHIRTGATTEAIPILEQVLTTCRNSDNPTGEAFTLHSLGDAHRQLKQYRQAEQCYQAALPVWDRIGSPRWRSRDLVRLAELKLETGHPQQALTWCRAALDLHPRVTGDAIHCDALITAADARRQLDRYDEAMADATAAINISANIADALRNARAVAVLADTLADTGDTSAAEARCREALQTLQNTDHPENRAVVDRLRSTARRLARPSHQSRRAG
ncbi:AfsR/SARP family transcriptional regulator [Micromonospora sp. NBC_01796]|uniref:AfsR/SARP family transcriptional regulator n=1 Tax=Micromonospora sp. NBC_01796 TaxID=2975987 RepID=UPI002DDC3041|nr:tetratricopeptide repeat protein [Micromonospora sp. NBC_01796]WSA83813.1 tetratricopeptide repeat protein [Micromonospora sp. NBC_01796]